MAKALSRPLSPADPPKRKSKPSCCRDAFKTGGAAKTLPAPSRIQKKGTHASITLVRQRGCPGRNRSGPDNRGAARRDRQGDELRDLRQRSSSLRSLHGGAGEGRRARPRVHGGSRRSRQRRERKAESRRARRGPVHHLLRRMRPVSEGK